MHFFFSACAALWQWLRFARVAAGAAVLMTAALGALLFMLGRELPEASVRETQDKLAQAQGEVRTFAKQAAAASAEINTMRARDEIHQKTIDLLQQRISELERSRLHWQERTAFYRYVLAEQSAGEILIHALAVTPAAFSPQQWELTAVLARPGGKRKAFAGRYYFEVVEAQEDGATRLTRLPAEAREFEMDFYHEINEVASLPPGMSISNLRLTVLDEKGETVVTAEMLGEDGADSAEAAEEENEASVAASGDDNTTEELGVGGGDADEENDS